MRVYRVEELVEDVVVVHYVTSAETPWEAVEEATGKAVQARTEERFWIRVTDEARRTVFKYASKRR